MNDDFIVDDEGFGYKDDHGGEIWEYEEDGKGDPKKKKQRKLNVSFSTFHFMFYVCRKMNSRSKTLCFQ